MSMQYPVGYLLDNCSFILPVSSGSKNPEGYKGKQSHLPGNTRKVGYNSQNHPWIDSWNVFLDWLIDHAFCCS